MKCLRCGYCCKKYFVPIIDDPEKGLQENNIVIHEGNGTPCKHLKGSKPGEYSCAIHDYPWYRETPCYGHIQIEKDPNEPCRVGLAFMERFANGLPVA